MLQSSNKYSFWFLCTYRVFQGTNYVALDVDQLTEQYGNSFYSHWDPTLREEVNLEETLEAAITNEEEPVLFASDGQRVQLRRGEPTGRPCGVMINLQAAPTFFREHADSDIPAVENHEAPPTDSHPALQVFPQAFLGNKGHYQASRLPQPFNRMIRMISRNVVINDNVDEDDFYSPISGASSQAYNGVMHRIRNRVATHDAQRAYLSGLAGSLFSTVKKDVETGDKLAAAMKGGNHPFDLLEAKINSDNLNTDLRMENVYHLDMSLIRNEYRRAEYVNNSFTLWPLLID